MVPRETIVDWFKVITDLEKAGVSNAELGRRVRPHKPFDRSTVHDWKMGVEPKYSVGQQILAIHASFVGKTPLTIA
jgi:hypothetical protein